MRVSDREKSTSPLQFQESGTRGAPSIIFLHGVGVSGWMWGLQTAALTDFHCLNVDLPGHGKSRHLEWTSFAAAAEHVAGLVRSHATNGRAHVVGLSLGGYVALKLLERHSRLVDHAVVSGVTARPMPNLALLKPQLWLVSALMHRRWAMNMSMRSMQVPPDMQDAFRENLLKMSTRTYRRVFEEAAYFHVPASLSSADNRTLIVAGGAETKIIVQAVRAISELMPNAKGVLAPRLHHGWNVEEPELFNMMVRAWITDLPLPNRLEGLNPE